MSKAKKIYLQLIIVVVFYVICSQDVYKRQILYGVHRKNAFPKEKGNPNRPDSKREKTYIGISHRSNYEMCNLRYRTYAAN